MAVHSCVRLGGTPSPHLHSRTFACISGPIPLLYIFEDEDEDEDDPTFRVPPTLHAPPVRPPVANRLPTISTRLATRGAGSAWKEGETLPRPRPPSLLGTIVVAGRRHKVAQAFLPAQGRCRGDAGADRQECLSYLSATSRTPPPPHCAFAFTLPPTLHAPPVRPIPSPTDYPRS